MERFQNISNEIGGGSLGILKLLDQPNNSVQCDNVAYGCYLFSL